MIFCKCQDQESPTVNIYNFPSCHNRYICGTMMLNNYGLVASKAQ